MDAIGAHVGCCRLPGLCLGIDLPHVVRRIGEFIQAVIDLDSDTTSMEGSRSGGELIEELRDARHSNVVDRGTWDVHPPGVPVSIRVGRGRVTP